MRVKFSVWVHFNVTESAFGCCSSIDGISAQLYTREYSRDCIISLNYRFLAKANISCKLILTKVGPINFTRKIIKIWTSIADEVALRARAHPGTYHSNRTHSQASNLRTINKYEYFIQTKVRRNISTYTTFYCFGISISKTASFIKNRICPSKRQYLM